MNSVLTIIVQTLASSALVILGFIAVRFTGLGERFLSHHLEKKINELKHTYDRDIESLRSDLAHLQDRGRRANELEFDALSKIWLSFNDAWLKTQQAIVDHLEFPDLDDLSEEDLVAFLESTELSDAQRKQVLKAGQKNEMYSKIMRLRRTTIAGAAIYGGRQVLRTNGIFIPAETAKSFRDGFDKLSEAQVERYMHFRHGRDFSGFKASMEVLDTTGTGMIADLEALVRSTIRRA
jgi:hypothetical protein